MKRGLPRVAGLLLVLGAQSAVLVGQETATRVVVVERPGVSVAAEDGVSAIAMAELATTLSGAFASMVPDRRVASLQLELVPHARLPVAMVEASPRGTRILVPWDETTSREEAGESIVQGLLRARRSAIASGSEALPPWLVTGVHRMLDCQGYPAKTDWVRSLAEGAPVIELAELLDPRASFAGGIGGWNPRSVAAHWLVHVLSSREGWLDPLLVASDPVRETRLALLRVASGEDSADSTEADAWWPVLFREASDSRHAGQWSASRSAWHAGRLARLVAVDPTGVERVLMPPDWHLLATEPELAALLAGRFAGVRFDLARCHAFRFNELLSAARAAGAAARGDPITATREGQTWASDRLTAAAMEAAVRSLLDG